jgi:hypothetical protein
MKEDTVPITMFYVSDKAYNHIVLLAQQCGYVKYGSNKVKGLSTFINDLAHTTFYDTRPELVKARHRDEMRMGRAPTWLHTRTRRMRNLQLDESTIRKFVEVALQVGIIRPEPDTIGGVSRLTPGPTVALVLEAIGLQWITPTVLPATRPANESRKKDRV